MTRLRTVPVSWKPTAVTTRTASGMSRRRCGQEGATPPPSLRRLRSTPPVSLRSVPHVLACRAIRSVPHAPGLRAPSDRSPDHRHARASGIARCRSGSRPRPVRHARAGRHSEVLPQQSCRSRHEESDGALASRLRRPRGMPVGGRCRRPRVLSPSALIARARLFFSMVEDRNPCTASRPSVIAFAA